MRLLPCRGGLWVVGGTLHSEIHSTVAQAMYRTFSHRAGLVERQQVGRAGEIEAKTIENLAFPAGEPGM